MPKRKSVKSKSSLSLELFREWRAMNECYCPVDNSRLLWNMIRLTHPFENGTAKCQFAKWTGLQHTGHFASKAPFITTSTKAWRDRGSKQRDVNGKLSSVAEIKFARKVTEGGFSFESRTWPAQQKCYERLTLLPCRSEGCVNPT